MPQGIQPEFELPAILRLPQVPPLKVPVRRQTQFIAPPSPVRYTEQVPITPQIAPENALFMPMPPTPPLISHTQTWIRSPYPANLSIPGSPIKGFIPTGKRSRHVGNGDMLLRPPFLIVSALLALAVLSLLSAAMS